MICAHTQQFPLSLSLTLTHSLTPCQSLTGRVNGIKILCDDCRFFSSSVMGAASAWKLKLATAGSSCVCDLIRWPRPTTCSTRCNPYSGTCERERMSRSSTCRICHLSVNCPTTTCLCCCFSIGQYVCSVRCGGYYMLFDRPTDRPSEQPKISMPGALSAFQKWYTPRTACIFT